MPDNVDDALKESPRGLHAVLVHQTSGNEPVRITGVAQIGTDDSNGLYLFGADEFPVSVWNAEEWHHTEMVD